MKILNSLLLSALVVVVYLFILISQVKVNAQTTCTPPPPGSPAGSPICQESPPTTSCNDPAVIATGGSCAGLSGPCGATCLRVEIVPCENGGVSVCREYATANCPVPETPVQIPPVCGAACNPSINTCPIGCPQCTTAGGGETFRCTSAPPPTEPPTATPTNPPSCNSQCQGNYQCQGAKDGCTQCINNTCQKPSPTPTNTPTPTVPACNTPCDNPAACQGARNGCTFCNPTTDKCEVPPTPTATVTPTKAPTPTATATPTATPTPLPFDESMCSCDGLSYGQNPTLGSPLTITGYGKVLGVNKNYAKIPTMKFALYKQVGATGLSVLDQTTVNTTVDSETAEKVRYKGIWTVNLPSTLEKGVNYRIKATPVCSRKTASVFAPLQNRVVLAATDQNPGFFGSVWNFVLGIFGAQPAQQPVQNVVVATPTLTEAQRRNLGLETFTPAKEVALENDPLDNCTVLRFKF